MSREQYLEMCEQMGWEPEEEEIPIDYVDLEEKSQQALRLFNILPDKIEGMNGVWLGKDYSGIGDIMQIYQIPLDKDIFDLLQVCIKEASDHYENQRKMKESSRKR
jgi:hypothetical protein